MPDAPGFREVDFVLNNAVSSNRSGFTGQTQTYRWVGAEYLSGTVTLPPMKRSDAQRWISFLTKCQGMANAFCVGDPLGDSPTGSVDQELAVSGFVPALSTSIPIRSYTPAPSAGILLEGDYIQVGARLYIVGNDVDVDQTGHASISVWPAVREAMGDGNGINTSGAQGLFRLADNQQTVQVSYATTYGMSFRITEAR